MSADCGPLIRLFAALLFDLAHVSDDFAFKGVDDKGYIFVSSCYDAWWVSEKYMKSILRFTITLASVPDLVC